MIKTYGVHGKYEEVADSQEIIDYFHGKDEIQVDTETTGVDPHTDKIISLQLGDSENQFFIDCRSKNILEFKELIEGRKCISQNAKFEYKMLKMVGIDIENIYDTMIAEVVLYCGYKDWGYGLDDLVLRYLEFPLSKEERAGFMKQGDKPFTEKQVEYGCLDVTYLQQIRDRQKWRIDELGLQYCIDLEMKVVKELANAGKLEAIKLKEELDRLVRNDPKLAPVYKPEMVQASMFEDVVVRDIKINYGSPLQIKEILNVLGYPVESTEERELKKITKKHKFIEKLLELRGIEKKISTYGYSFLENVNPVTGRIHTSFWQIVETGRLSSKEPNMQNIPADAIEYEEDGIKKIRYPYREPFIVPEGYKWVGCDYSGQELRIMADASGEKGFLDVLNSGEDLHCYAGSMMFGKKITKKDKVERTKAKTINFGKPYGMAAPKLADMLDIAIEEAEKLFKLYAKAFPVLNKWLAGLGNFAKKNHYSVTMAPCKRRRFFPDMEEAKKLRKTVRNGDKDTWRKILMIEGSTEREGGNSPIQGTGADICKEALVACRDYIKQFNALHGKGTASMILTVHDEINFLVKEAYAPIFAKEAERIMVEQGNKYVTKVNMEVETTITNFWTK
jgi:DNA polymerase-1